MSLNRFHNIRSIEMVDAKGIKSQNMVPWEKLRKQLRASLLEQDDSLESARFSHHLSCLTEQLALYERAILSPIKSGDWSYSKEEKKNIILTTRQALLFALACFAPPATEAETKSFSPSNIQTRQRRLQYEAIHSYHWDEKLSYILSCNVKDDAKCRLYVARLWCNLVTQNPETASFVSGKVPLAPSDGALAKRMLHQSSLASNDDKNCSNISSTELYPTWVDMIVSCAHTGNRDALAAVVAALHNCMASLDLNATTDSLFSKQVASCSLLVSTLLRQVISVDSLYQKNGRPLPSRIEYQQINQNHRQDQSSGIGNDPAKEWILLVIRRLLVQGELPTLYRSSGGDKEENTTNETSNILSAVLPEQMVLLHCVQWCIDEGALTGSINMESDGLSGSAAQASVIFLVKMFDQISIRLIAKDKCANDDDDLQILGEYTQPIILTILADIIEFESPDIVPLRLLVGQQPCFIKQLGQSMASIVDNVLQSQKNNVVASHTKKIKTEMVEKDQALLTSIVRLLGNLCFHCKANQDLLRHTSIPLAPEHSAAAVALDRNILHVLLSCTSFSFLCFTLREWAVVAIRNALQDNPDNQALVAALEAKQAVQSTELNEMGVRVEMDAKGKVNVVPLTPPNEADEHEET